MDGKDDLTCFVCGEEHMTIMKFMYTGKKANGFRIHFIQLCRECTGVAGKLGRSIFSGHDEVISEMNRYRKLSTY
jgi:hypothetical protein